MQLSVEGFVVCVVVFLFVLVLVVVFCLFGVCCCCGFFESVNDSTVVIFRSSYCSFAPHAR